MIERKAIQIRLYPTPEQVSLFRRTAGLCRLVYNLALDQRRMFGRRGRTISYNTQAAELSSLKAEFPFVAEAPHHCLQQALVNLDRAYKRFWAGESKAPRHKRRRDGDSFRFPDPKQFSLSDGELKLPKAGLVKGIVSRALPSDAKIKSVTVLRDGTWWVASLQYEVEVAVPVDRSSDPMIGIDLGVTQPIVTSNGDVFKLPKISKRRRLRQRRLQQQIARTKKGSNNRRRAVARLSAHAAKDARVRRDVIEKVTTHLAKNHGCIAMEDLRIKNMTASAAGTVEEPGRNVRQKAGLNRSILEVSPGIIRLRLRQKLAASGGMLLLVPAAYSSQRCSRCGTIDASNRLTRDRFECIACGFEADADINAAENLRQRALGRWGDHAQIKIAASLPLLLGSQSKPKRSFKKQPAEGTPAAVCGDLCASGQGMSAKQKSGDREITKLAA